MPYSERSDGRIAVTIDSNIWNLFHRLGVNLVRDLPVARFALFIPREVEIELAAIPDVPMKAALRAYVRDQITASGMRVTAVFGFARDDGEPERCGGFDWGTFQSEDELNYYAVISAPYLHGRRMKGSRLTGNEADAALGAASLASVVLTLDVKPGPLRIATQHGGKVLDMSDFETSDRTLADHIERFYLTG